MFYWSVGHSCDSELVPLSNILTIDTARRYRYHIIVGRNVAKSHSNIYIDEAFHQMTTVLIFQMNNVHHSANISLKNKFTRKKRVNFRHIKLP